MSKKQQENAKEVVNDLQEEAVVQEATPTELVEEKTIEEASVMESASEEVAFVRNYDENASSIEKTSFRKYLLNIWLSFLDSFKYNPCKLAGILIALPGLFIGFFLNFHANVSFIVRPGEANLSGFYMFLMVLFGCINIFNGVTFSSKRNLGTLIVSAVCSLVILVFGVLWIYSIINSFAVAKEISLETPIKFDVNYAMSVICVALAIISSAVGCILGYFKRDKNYKKVKF